MMKKLFFLLAFGGAVSLLAAPCGKCDNVCGDRGRANCVVIQSNCSQKCQGWEDRGVVAIAVPGVPFAD
jgi:hypothetical protein